MEPWDAHTEIIQEQTSSLCSTECQARSFEFWWKNIQTIFDADSLLNDSNLYSAMKQSGNNTAVKADYQQLLSIELTWSIQKSMNRVACRICSQALLIY